MNKLAILIALALTSAGCPKKTSPADINGEWTCLSIAKIGTLNEVRPTAKVDVAKKTFGGTSGCNTYFSNLDTPGGGKIAITGIGSTKMACDGERATVESAFFEVLQSAKDFEVKGGKLVLSGAGGPLAVFTKN